MDNPPALNCLNPAAQGTLAYHTCDAKAANAQTVDIAANPASLWQTAREKPTPSAPHTPAPQAAISSAAPLDCALHPEVVKDFATPPHVEELVSTSAAPYDPHLQKAALHLPIHRVFCYINVASFFKTTKEPLLKVWELFL